MKHDIRRKHPTPSNPPRRLHRQLRMHIHVLDIRSRIHGNLIPPQLLLVEQRRPLRILRYEIRDVLDFAELGVVLEHVGEDHLAGEVDGVGLLVEVELGEFGEEALGGPVGSRAGAVDGFVEDGVEEVAVEGLGVVNGAEGRSCEVAEELGCVRLIVEFGRNDWRI